jgi:hypothetical protein
MALIDAAVMRFKGPTDPLRGAIGYFFIARQVGWKPALLMFSQKTVREYEEILQINSRDMFPEVGPMANKSIAWRLSLKVSNFWKAVKGEIKGIRTNEVDDGNLTNP